MYSVFGLLVACGLMIRVNLKPFEPAFHRLLTEGSDPETERAISGSLRRSKTSFDFRSALNKLTE